MANHPGQASDIRKRELKNGLVVVSEAMPHVRSVSIGIWIAAGSRFEPARLNGISHFIEHLLFKGTRTRTAGDIARAVDSVGGQLDAFTDKEYVGVYARVMDRHISRAFDILGEIVLYPSFAAGEIRRERNVIFEEINTIEDSPQDLIHDLHHERLWSDHPIGRPITGTKETVGRMRRKDIQEYFQRHYAARNMVLTVAGNIRHREVHGFAQSHFGGVAAGVAADPGPAPAARPGRHIRDKENLEQVHICLGTLCPPLVSQDRFCAHLLSTILGGGVSSRLFQNIREKKGLVYSIESNLNLYRDAGSLVVSAAASPSAAGTVVELILREFRRMKAEPVSSDELRRAKDFLEGSLMLGLESSSARMTHLAQQQLYFGRIFTPSEITDFLEKVKPKDIRRMAGEIFLPSSLALTALGHNSGPKLDSVDLQV
jgi:predicted Zn-dependent peptidase